MSHANAPGSRRADTSPPQKKARENIACIFYRHGLNKRFSHLKLRIHIKWHLLNYSRTSLIRSRLIRFPGCYVHERRSRLTPIEIHVLVSRLLRLISRLLRPKSATRRSRPRAFGPRAADFRSYVGNICICISAGLFKLSSQIQIQIRSNP